MAQSGAKYKVGMVGCGRQGTQHARGFTLLPETRVVAIADPDPDNLALACRRFDARGYSSAEEMYANEELDIVDCVLPVRYNPDMVVLAAERSGAKGIVSEKPIAAKLSDADRMLEACTSRGDSVAGGQCRPEPEPDVGGAGDYRGGGDRGGALDQHVPCNYAVRGADAGRGAHVCGGLGG